MIKINVDLLRKQAIEHGILTFPENTHLFGESEKIFQDVLNIMKACGKISKVDIYCKDVDTNKINSFFEALGYCEIESLSINDLDIRDKENEIVFLENFYSNKLGSLSLCQCTFPDNEKFNRLFSQSLKLSTIEKLELIWVNISEQGMADICNALQNHNSIVNLDIRLHELSTQILNYLIYTLPPKIHTLKISSLRMTESNILLLKNDSHLENLNNLLYLKFTAGYNDENISPAFFDLIARSPELISIEIQNCDQGAIFECLSDKYSIEKLTISKRASKEELMYLFRLLENNDSLKSLSIMQKGFNFSDPDLFTSFGNMLYTNNALQYILLYDGTPHVPLDQILKDQRFVSTIKKIVNNFSLRVLNIHDNSKWPMGIVKDIAYRNECLKYVLKCRSFVGVGKFFQQPLYDKNILKTILEMASCTRSTGWRPLELEDHDSTGKSRMALMHEILKLRQEHTPKSVWEAICTHLGKNNENGFMEFLNILKELELSVPTETASELIADEYQTVNKMLGR